MYKKNDEVVFQINDTAFTYKVVNPDPNQWFLSAVGNSNDVVFKKLHIHNKKTFVVDASGCMLAHHEGVFPVIRCDDESGINKVINALQQKCAEISSQPDTSSKPTVTSLYKKCDVVRIMYKDGDRVTFRIDNDHLIYTVSHDNGCWWLSNSNGYNSEIFHKLHISDRFEFVHKISQHMSTKKDASFPEVWCNDETEINKVIDALLKACDEYNRHNRREIPYVPEQCATLEYKIKLGKPKNKYQLKFTN